MLSWQKPIQHVIKKDSSRDTQLENAKLQQQIFAIHKISKQEFTIVIVITIAMLI
jgi:hypothetical protein